MRVLLPLALFAVALGIYGFVNAGREVNLDYFVPLADAFLHGRLDLAEHPSWLNELVPFEGRYYVVYPPAPAVLVVPFVAVFGRAFDQAGASLLIGAANVAIATDLLRRLGLTGRTWALTALLFAFGTVAWYSAQAASRYCSGRIMLAFLSSKAAHPAALAGSLMTRRARSAKWWMKSRRAPPKMPQQSPRWRRRSPRNQTHSAGSQPLMG